MKQSRIEERKRYSAELAVRDDVRGVKRIRPRETVELRCECGHEFVVSSRADRSRRAEGRKPVCSDCRDQERRPALVVTDALVEWWASRFSPAQALEVAEMIWGPRRTWTASLDVVRAVERAAGYTEDDFREIMSA